MVGITRKRWAGMLSALTMTWVLVLILAPMASAKGPVVHRVSVGGPDSCAEFGGQPGCEANFSLVALAFADESVEGQYTDRSRGSNGFHAVIDCVFVDGSEAWVSGVIITQGPYVGLPVATRVRDNGTSANDPPDQISYSHVGDPTPCTEQIDYPLLDAPQGQVVVVD